MILIIQKEEHNQLFRQLSVEFLVRLIHFVHFIHPYMNPLPGKLRNFFVFPHINALVTKKVILKLILQVRRGAESLSKNVDQLG